MDRMEKVGRYCVTAVNTRNRVLTRTAPVALLLSFIIFLTFLGPSNVASYRPSWKISEASTDIPYYYFRDGHESIKASNNKTHNHKVPIKANSDFVTALKALFKLIRHPLTDHIYIDQDNNTWTYPSERTEWKPIWTQSLGDRLCIFDMDNRVYNETGQTFAEGHFNWDVIDQTPSGVFNHYLYALIHGYRYNFIQVPEYEMRSVYWAKIPTISDMLLDGCEIVVSIDHDAIFQNLNLPMEWLLNHWNFTRKTSFAMALDNHWGQNEDEQGVLNINAGFIVTQNLPRTHDILRAWDSCPSNSTAYPGCRKFIWNWPSEQGAWGNFMRREFNETDDYIEIPCTEANGFPGMGTECFGELIRHYTIGKDRIHNGVASGLAQAVMGMARQHLLYRQQDVRIRRDSNDFTKSWSYEGGGAHGDGSESGDVQQHSLDKGEVELPL